MLVEKGSPIKRCPQMTSPAFSGPTAWIKVLNNTHFWKEGQLPDRASRIFNDDDLDLLREALADLEWVDGTPPGVIREFLNAGLVRPFEMNQAPDFIAAAIRIGGELKEWLQAGNYSDKFHSKVGIKSLQNLTLDGAKPELVEKYLTVVPLMAKNRPEFQEAVRRSPLFDQWRKQLLALVDENRATHNMKYALVNAMGSCLHGTDKTFWKKYPKTLVSPVRVMACDLPLEQYQVVIDAANFALERVLPKEEKPAEPLPKNEESAAKPQPKNKKNPAEPPQNSEKSDVKQKDEFIADLIHLYAKLAWCDEKLALQNEPLAADINILMTRGRIEPLLLAVDPEKMLDHEALDALHLFCCDMNRAYYEQDLSAYESFKTMLIRLRESKLAEHAKREEERNERRRKRAAGRVKVLEPPSVVPQDQPGSSGTRKESYPTQKKNLSPVVEADVQDSPREDPVEPLDPVDEQTSPEKTPYSLTNPFRQQNLPKKPEGAPPSLPPQVPMYKNTVASHFKVDQVYSSDEYLQLMIDEGKVVLPPSPEKSIIEIDDDSVDDSSESGPYTPVATSVSGESGAALVDTKKKAGFFSRLFK